MTHECPCGCGKQIERHRLACPRGWYRLPADLRQAINDAYRGPDSDPAAHRRLLADAAAWYRNHPRPVVGA